MDDDETAAYLLFMSDQGKHMLSTYDSWACDGTFSTAPNLFAQIFFVGAVTGSGKMIPAVHCLLPDKSGATYSKVFNAIKDVVGNTDHVKMLYCDYERAIHSAFDEICPAADIAGCLFHFRQSVHR